MLNSGTEPVYLGRINFNEYSDVSTAFAKLFTVCQQIVKFSDENFNVIRNSCIAITSNLNFQEELQQTTNTDNLFEVLAENKKYCNWMDVTYLKVIATAYKNDQLLSLIESYTNVIYSKTLGEIWNDITYRSVKHKFYKKICAKFDTNNPDHVTLGMIIKYTPQLANNIVMLSRHGIIYLREGSTYVYVYLYVCIII